MHKLLLFVLAVMMFSIRAEIVVAPNKDSSVKFRDCFTGSFSNYESWFEVIKEKYALSTKDPEVLANKLAMFKGLYTKESFDYYKENLTCENIRYKVGEALVYGFVIKPKNITGKIPTIIYNRGGNGNYGAVIFGSMFGELFPLADRGFVIIGSQYRGTFTDNTKLDEFGGEDVNDVVALMDVLPQVKGADVNRIGMYGFSRGGMQTHLAVKKMPYIKAIAIGAGDVDAKKELDFRPEMENVYKLRIPNYAADKEAQLANRSVITWADRLSRDMPILLFHGELDKRVSVENSKSFSKALDEYKIPHKLVLYKDDNHNLFKNRDAVLTELETWFKTYL